MISHVTGTDLQAIATLQPPGWQDIIPYFRFYHEMQFCRPIKYEVDGELAGVGAALLHDDSAWLAHIIVADNRRQQGIGTQLTRYLIKIAESEGIETQFLVATAQGRRIYEPLGFRESGRYAFHAHCIPEERELGVETRPLASGDLENLLCLDHAVTGEERREMIGCFPPRGVVVDDPGGGLLGCYLPDLGDGAVMALNAEVGLELLRLRLMDRKQGVVIPEGNLAGIEWLAQQGAELKGSAPRMVRNGEDPLRQTRLFQRAGGHIG